MSEDDRSTPIGLFNYARSYWQSGVLLHKAKPRVTHPGAPITLLLAHAIELYLKSFLRLQGLGIEEVKMSFGHDFQKLIDEASARGLPVDDEDVDLATVLAEQESIRRSRYIETGYYQRPPLAAMSRTCKNLDNVVSAALLDSGHPLQATALEHIETDD